jgi:hypothetical protein
MAAMPQASSAPNDSPRQNAASKHASTIVGPGGVSAWKLTTTSADERRHDADIMAAANVALKLRLAVAPPRPAPP